MPPRQHKIQIPKVILQSHLTDLLTDILLDWREERHIAQPEKVSDRPFRDRKYAIIGPGHHAAVLLTLEYLVRNPGAVAVHEIVEGDGEWDLTEFAAPFVPEWRRRWAVPLPDDWLAAVELTDEDLLAWRERRAAGVALPPELALPGQDLRHAFARLGWHLADTRVGWQRLEERNATFDLIVPADDVETEPAMIRLVYAWYSAAVTPESVAVPDDLPDRLARLADRWAADGHRQVAEVLRLLDPDAEPVATARRLAVAAERLPIEQIRASGTQYEGTRTW